MRGSSNQSMKNFFVSFADTYELVVTLEENVKDGGFGERVLAFAEEEDLPFGVEIIALPDRFIPHGSVSYQMKQVGFTPEDILRQN